MDVRPTALATRACNQPGKRTSVLAICIAILGIQVSAVVLLWFMAVLPPLVALLLAVALAIAWCIWLEKHPESSAATRRDHPIPNVPEYRSF